MDLNALNSWNSPSWRDLRVLVLGSGVTGFSVADTLLELGSRVLVATRVADLPGAMVNGSDQDAKRQKILRIIGADVVDISEVENLQISQADNLLPPQTKGLYESSAENAQTPIGRKMRVPGRILDFAPQIIMTSPAFGVAHPILSWAREAGIPVWGDIELAWRLRDRKNNPEFIFITGTNGKTTTSQLVVDMLNASGKRAAACGNIGIPILDIIRSPDAVEFLVVEVSSFQLESYLSVKPIVSCVLNVDKDHLNRHKTFFDYCTLKAKVYENTKIACVYPAESAVVRKMVEQADVQSGCRAVGFAARVPMAGDVGIVDVGEEGAGQSLIIADRAFSGNPQTEAVELAPISAIGLVQSVQGGNMDDPRTQAPRTQSPPDTDSTSDVQSVSDAESEMCDLGAQSKIHPVMFAAVRTAHQIAKPGDFVILAPGCASYPVFRDYAHRGSEFTRAVRCLLPKGHLPKESGEKESNPHSHPHPYPPKWQIHNILAACAIARSIGCEPLHIRTAIEGFRPDPHRGEVVARDKGITWINNSKATNPHAVDAFFADYSNIVWIAGGDAKGVDLMPKVKKYAKKIRAVILLQDAPALISSIQKHLPQVALFTQECMKESCRQAVSMTDRAQENTQSRSLHVEGSSVCEHPAEKETNGPHTDPKARTGGDI